MNSLVRVPPVVLEHIHTHFGQNVVHEDVNLTVEQGEIVALVGGSGSGKTTLLRQVSGLIHPTIGDVYLFGERLDEGDQLDRQARKRRFGMLFQGGALFSALTVFDNIAFALRELKILFEDEIRAIVMSRLALVELDPSVADLMPSQLSGGMVKRVALARALVLEPELLLLDEPTAGLDPDRSASFVRLIRSLQEQLGLTVLYVTHDLDTLLALSTRIAVLADRHIVAYGSFEEISAVNHPFVQSFFKSVRLRVQHATPSVDERDFIASNKNQT